MRDSPLLWGVAGMCRCPFSCEVLGFGDLFESGSSRHHFSCKAKDS